MGSYSEGLIFEQKMHQAKEMYKNSHMRLNEIAELTGLNVEAMIEVKESVDEEKQAPYRELTDEEIALLKAFRELKFKGKQTVLMVANQLAYGDDWDLRDLP